MKGSLEGREGGREGGGEEGKRHQNRVNIINEWQHVTMNHNESQ